MRAWWCASCNGAGGRPAATPARAPVFSNLLGDGLQTVLVGDEQWRVFVKTNAKGVRVAVGQQTTRARRRRARQCLAHADADPVPGAGAGAAGRDAGAADVQAAQELADELGRRPAHDLRELDETALPSEVRPFVVEINQLLARIGRSMALQRRFVADAAHELRSPLTAMSLQAERLGATAMPAEARGRLDALIAGLQRTRGAAGPAADAGADPGAERRKDDQRVARAGDPPACSRTWCRWRKKSRSTSA